MQCPKCKCVLRKVKHGEIIVDACDLCYGIWLDAGELEKIAEYSAGSRESAIAQLSEILNSDSKIIESESRECPTCKKTMQQIQFATKDNIIVDKCIGCKGIWFDAGEIVSITDFVKPKAGVKDTAAGKEKKSKMPEKSQAPNFSLLPSLLGLIAILGLFGIILNIMLKYFK